VILMKLNITKNFIIAFFVLLAVYQTSELWFEGFSNHNFFYSFFYNYNKSNDDGLLYSLDSIIVNKGNDRLICLKNDIYKNDYKSIFDDAVRITMKNGSVIQGSEFDWNNLLSVKSVVYQYSCGIDSRSIGAMFGAESGFLSDFSEKIDTIVIIPYTTTTPERLTIGFGARTSGKARFYSLEKNQYVYTVYDAIDAIAPSNDIYYTSSAKNGLDLFNGNLFIPQWSGQEFKYSVLKAENPFIQNGNFEQIKLERAVDAFFDNPVSKWSSFLNGVYSYSDENTVVKYFQNGVMEYYNYGTEKNIDADDFYSQYESALALLKRDSGIKNEYFFKGYSFDAEKTIFYFDYKINNFSISLSDYVKNNIGMDSVIEITVSEGRVSKYRRFVMDFWLDEDEQLSVRKGFLKAIDEVFADIQRTGEKRPKAVDAMELIYIYPGDENGYLSWFISIDGKKHIKKA